MERFMGAGIMIVSTICYALLLPLTKKPSQVLPPFTLMAITMFVLFTITVIASIIFENSLHIKHSLIRSNILPLIIVGVINFFGYWLLLLGIKYFTVWQQQMFTLLVPILGGIAAYFILGETMSVKLFIGLAIISVGLFVALR